MKPFLSGFVDELEKLGKPSKRAVTRATEMGLRTLSKRRQLPLGNRFLWKKANGDMLQYFQDHPEKLKAKQKRDQLKKHAGSSVKKQLTFDGYKLKLEYLPGDLRKGVNKKTGEPWERRMHASYGYIPGTKGVDGEAVDVYLARHPKPGMPIFIIHQVREDGSHDEDKVVMGVATEAEAKALYLQHTPAKCFGSIMTGTRKDFDEYLTTDLHKKERRAA